MNISNVDNINANNVITGNIIMDNNSDTHAACGSVETGTTNNNTNSDTCVTSNINSNTGVSPGLTSAAGATYSNTNSNTGATYSNSTSGVVGTHALPMATRCATKYNYDTILDFKKHNYDDCKNFLTLIKNVIKEKKLIIYGGLAIHYVLKLKGHKGLYDDEKLPDYDIYSNDFYNDSNNITIYFYNLGYKNAVCTTAMHISTRTIKLGFERLCDVSYVGFPTNKLPTLQYEGLYIIDPLFQRISIYLALSMPYSLERNENLYFRFDKDYNRLLLLDEYYPIDVKIETYKNKKIDISSLDKTKYISGLVAYAVYYGLSNNKDNLLPITLENNTLEVPNDILFTYITYYDFLKKYKTDKKFVKRFKFNDYIPKAYIIPVAPVKLPAVNAAPAALVKPNASNIYTNLTSAAGNIYTNLTTHTSTEGVATGNLSPASTLPQAACVVQYEILDIKYTIQCINTVKYNNTEYNILNIYNLLLYFLSYYYLTIDNKNSIIYLQLVKSLQRMIKYNAGNNIFSFSYNAVGDIYNNLTYSELYRKKISEEKITNDLAPQFYPNTNIDYTKIDINKIKFISENIHTLIP